MKIRTISYSRTYNTGNYTSRRFEATAELDEQESLADQMEELARQLHSAANAVLNPPRTNDEEETEIPF